MFLHLETEWCFGAKSADYEWRIFQTDIFPAAFHDFQQESGFFVLLMDTVPTEKHRT